MASVNIVVKVEAEEFVVVKEETVDLAEETECYTHQDYASIKLDCETLPDVVRCPMRNSHENSGLKSQVDEQRIPRFEKDGGKNEDIEDVMNPLHHLFYPAALPFPVPYMTHAMPWGMYPPSPYFPYPYRQLQVNPFPNHHPHMTGQVHQPKTPDNNQDFHSNLSLDGRPLPPGKVKMRFHTTSTPYNRTEPNPRSVDCPVVSGNPTQNNTSSNISEHMQLHMLDRPFRCKECAESFTKKYHLTLHKQVHMQKSRPHQCTKCGRSFTKKHHLYNHMQTHTVRNVFKCSMCDMTFYFKSKLKRHVVTHIPERTSDVKYNEF